jgi:hypothetical protein
LSAAVRRLLGWTGLSALAWVALAWLLWKYVPVHAAILADKGAALPLATRITIAGAFWFVRMLPFIVLGGILGWPFIAGVVVGLAILCARWKPALSILVVAAILTSLVGIIGCAFVVLSVRMAY